MPLISMIAGPFTEFSEFLELVFQDKMIVRQQRIQ